MRKFLIKILAVSLVLSLTKSGFAGGIYQMDLTLNCLFFDNNKLVHQQACNANGGGGGNVVAAHGDWHIKNPISKALPRKKIMPFVNANLFGRFNIENQRLEQWANASYDQPKPLTPVGTQKLALRAEVSSLLGLDGRPILDENGSTITGASTYEINELPATYHIRFAGSLIRLTEEEQRLAKNHKLLDDAGKPVSLYHCLSPTHKPTLEVCISEDFVW